MYPRDAQDSLDTIHFFQGRSVDEHVNHGFARPFVLLSALAVFVAFASFDLPGPWDRLAVALGLGLLAAVSVSWQRRARVHRKPTGLELLYYLVAAIVFLLVYVAFQVAAVVLAWKFGLPAQHTFAAAATAVMVVLTARPARKVFARVARHAVASKNR